jgi:transcriptional regulator with XRE-family HTH domain
LAERVGCTSGYISQIEKGKANLSIATLKKVATALEVKLVDFFIEDDEGEDIVIKKGKGFEIQYPQGDASIFLLVRKLSGRNMEPLLARFEPNSGSHGLYSHAGGQEFGFVVTGELDLTVEDNVFQLKKGDSFYFDSARPHGYVNNGKEISEVIWVISPPTY